MRVILWLLFCAGVAYPAELGEKAGPLDLTTLDGRRLTMANYGERLATAVVFLSARCDASQRAAATLARINQQHRLGGVLLVGVFPNAAESGAEVRRFAQHLGLVFPVYRDPGGQAAKEFGAEVTPEAYLLDRQGTLVYRGSVEGLAGAVAKLAAGKPVDPSHVPAEGTPIGRPGPPRTFEDRFGSVWFSSELIFEKIPDAPAHHASTIAKAANGDLLAVWYGGSYESSDDQTLFLARRKKGARAWDPPQALIRDSLQPPGNAVVFRDGRDRIWIVWARMEGSRPVRRGGGWGETRLMYRTSEDHGVSWTQDRPMPADARGLPRNVPVLLPDGALLLPMGERGGSYTLRTADYGETWVRSILIAGGGQPTVAQRPDGSLLALMRRRPRIMQSESHDGGMTWSPAAPSALKNPDAGIAMTRLSNGHLVLVFNDSETARTPLSMALSLDGGQSWEQPLVLEANPGEYSYPSVIQDSDGRIHVTYTFRRYSIKHVEMDEEWLARLERPN
ncbi:MAG: exo-alpha-sialidase [Acidobacteriota bacterium]